MYNQSPVLARARIWRSLLGAWFASSAAALCVLQQAPARAEAPPAAAQAPVWSSRVQSTWLGPSGGLHVVGAEAGPVGSLRLQLGIDFFSTGDFMLAGDHDEYAGGTLALAATVTDSLELFGSFASHANWNDHESPQLLQVLGDTLIGAKLLRSFTPWLTLGGDLRIVAPDAVGDIGPAFDALGLGIRASATADLRALENPAPLLARLTLDYDLDNSAQLIAAVEDARYAAIGEDRRPRADEDRQLVRRVERFALGINRTDAIDLGFGLEAPLRVSDSLFVHPLIEWTLAIPVNRQGFDCLLVPGDAGRAGEDGCLDEEGLAAMASTFSIGARVFPKVPGLSLLLAADIGLGGVSTFVRELAPNKPYDVLIAVAYATDVRPPAPALERVVMREVTTPEPPRPRVRGSVLEAGTGAPIEGAIVTYPGRELTAQVTDASGRFVSYELAPGPVRFEVTHPGYESRTCAVDIPAPIGASARPAAPDAPGHEPALNPYIGAHGAAAVGEQAGRLWAVHCELTAKPVSGSLRGRVLGDGAAPVAGAQVELSGPSTQSLVTDAQGVFELATLPPGHYSARVDAAGYLMRLQSFEVTTTAPAAPEIALTARSERADVELTSGAVQIHKQIAFDSNSADISPTSHDLLAQVADVLLRNPQVQHVEIQGHTDNRGKPDANLQLSQQRADAVRAWLVDAGVEPSRLVAKGYGDSQPLVPNRTERDRARNRRVEFVIEQP